MEISNARSQKKLVGPCDICGAAEDAYHKAMQHGTLAST